MTTHPCHNVELRLRVTQYLGRNKKFNEPHGRYHHQIAFILRMLIYHESKCTQYCFDFPSRWRYNGHGSVSNHQPHHCLLSRLFGCRSKKTSKLRVTSFVRGIHRRPVNSPHIWPATRKMFPFDDVFMRMLIYHRSKCTQYCFDFRSQLDVRSAYKFG